MGNLSPHFSRQEFACKDGCGYGQPHRELVQRLEALRTRLGGKPIVVVSGLRCPPRNSKVGGAVRSRHQSGEAADLVSGLVRPGTARAAGFTGIGVKDGWVIHVDVRDTKEVVQWTYSGSSSGG
jgi:uncharacterized protein YcbK (DUF882 family)